MTTRYTPLVPFEASSNKDKHANRFAWKMVQFMWPALEDDGPFVLGTQFMSTPTPPAMISYYKAWNTYCKKRGYDEYVDEQLERAWDSQCTQYNEDHNAIMPEAAAKAFFDPNGFTIARLRANIQASMEEDVRMLQNKIEDRKKRCARMLEQLAHN